MKSKIIAATFLALLLGGCTGRFVGFTECAKDGSPVWQEYPNAAGNYDGLDVSAANCKH
jgi:hypothetical protein